MGKAYVAQIIRVIAVLGAEIEACLLSPATYVRSFGSANVDQTRATVGLPSSLSWKFYNIYICEEEEEGQSRSLTCLFNSSPLPGIELFPPLVPAIGGRTRILWELIMLRAFSWETALAATIDCPLQHPLHSTRPS